MVKIITQNLRNRRLGLQNRTDYTLNEEIADRHVYLPRNAKFLAWCIFLIFFIENGTLGIFPRQFYFVYRNMRISDLLIYAVIIYSFFCIREYSGLFSSKSLLIIKILLIYYVFVFIGSALVYDYNIIEFFFRMKFLWASFLIFPYLLLFQRKAFLYLIRIIFPFAVLSNILYILSSFTGTAYLPDINIVKQTLPGGFKIYRVYGGTFFGDMFFLGYIYFWITKKFKPHQLIIVLIFMLPHILAFGRSSWIFFTFAICVIFLWNTLKNKSFKTALKQIVMAVILFAVVLYILTQFFPQSSELTEAIGSRIQQGQEDYQYKEGTYGTRVENTGALINLWLSSNVLVGIGMHPLWVINPVTAEESIYYWGFSDLIGPGVLAAYGLIGLTLISLTQLIYGITTFKIIKNAKIKDIYIFLIIIFLCRIIFVSLSYNILIIGLWGPSITISLYIAAVTYKYEHQLD